MKIQIQLKQPGASMALSLWQCLQLHCVLCEMHGGALESAVVVSAALSEGNEKCCSQINAELLPVCLLLQNQHEPPKAGAMEEAAN